MITKEFKDKEGILLRSKRKSYSKREYIKKCGFGKNHSPKLGKLDPYWFSDELKNSIPKEEFLKLVDAYYDKETNFAIKRLL